MKHAHCENRFLVIMHKTLILLPKLNNFWGKLLTDSKEGYSAKIEEYETIIKLFCT